MYHRFWSYLFYLYGLVAQVIWPCEEPAKISAGSLNTAEYFGSWYFIAAAGESDSDLQIFKHMDNTLFDLQGADIPERLLLQGAIKVGNHCVEKNWVYYIHHYRDDLELEGRPLMKSYIFESDCKDCIIMMETQDKGEHQFKRMMLYARTSTLSSEHIEHFQKKAACVGMKEFMVLPREKEYCLIEPHS
ncbi:apolipoprotein M-like [Polyodon spathula]|uniref:apolipoprotein M-like n=1 Tax=Polyodon spathula TaxID=7913 RepID=UPI001B7F241D|nr:apolipoprotein M-like [Polyodon spathula]